MSQLIQQSVVLPAPAARLFQMYLDPAEHAAITGKPVTIGREPGSEFAAFDGALTGGILQVVPDRLIVQSWRSRNWRPDDVDSTLVLTFWPDCEQGRIDLVHVNVADCDAKDVTEGWGKYYWTPWRAYIEKP